MAGPTGSVVGRCRRTERGRRPERRGAGASNAAGSEGGRGGGRGRAGGARGPVDGGPTVHRRDRGQGDDSLPEGGVLVRHEAGFAGRELGRRHQAGGDGVLPHLGRRPLGGVAEDDLVGGGVGAHTGEEHDQGRLVVVAPVDGDDVVGQQGEGALGVDHHVGRRRPLPGGQLRRGRARGVGLDEGHGYAPDGLGARSRYQPRLPLGRRGACGFCRSSR